MFKLRRTKRVAVTCVLALLTLAADALVGQDRGARQRQIVMLDGREVVEGEVIVRYRDEAGSHGRERAEFQVASEGSRAVGRAGARRLRSRHLSTRELIETLRANPDVDYVEPNYVIRANAIPNDPSFGNLWGLHNTGQSVDGRNGVPGADIGAVAAWDVHTGSRANIVAVLDTGVDVTHPDLTGNVFTAPRQFSVTISGATLTCPAGSRGFNAMTNTCNAVDDNGHGTHVAGIIGAVGNNNVGVTGVSWTTTLLPLKVLDATGTGVTTDAIEAIEFAIGLKNALGADGNVRVLNASWGGSVFSQALSDQIQAASNADMLVVASAGSGGNDNDTSPHYPASLTQANVISVAAVDNTGALAAYSNYGSTSVDLGAPGDSTLSTLPNNEYGYMGGTSIAAPFVSGAAALTLAACPSNTTTLKARLLSNVDPVASLAGKSTAGGSLNVGRVLQQCRPTVQATVTGGTITAVVENGPANQQDWLGLFCPASGTDSAYSDWKFLNNSRTVPASGVSSATVTFTGPTQSGVQCNVRLFTNAPVYKLATSNTVTTGVTPTITINTPSVASGGTISFTVANSPGNPTDWVGLVPESSPDTGFVSWIYLNGTKTAPSTGITNATLQFTAPAAAGSYDIRLFSNNSYTRLARSSAVTVGSAPALTINDVSLAEGNSGTTVATFTVSMSPVNTSQTVTVNYATANGSATAGSDYTAASGTVTFSPSTATRTISVTIAGDTVNEANETFTVNLSSAVNATIADAQGIGTITNDDAAAAPTITVNTPNVASGGTISFTVANSPGNPNDWVGLVPLNSPDTAWVSWVYLNGTKTAPATGITNATLQFTAPAAAGSYDIRLFSNNTYTRLARSGAINVGSGPTLNINDVTLSEGNSGTTLANFTVTLSPVNASQTVTVNYATANGSATAGSDYTAASGTLTFSPGTATQTISVTIAGDATNEANETFTVNLSSAANAAIADAQGVGTITNDDTASGPSVTINTPTVTAGGTISFTVANGPGNTTDWVGLIPVDSPDTAWVSWVYLNGTKTAPAAGITNATLQFTAPATAGSYDVRLFTSDSYNRIARSGPVTVSSGPTLTINDVNVTEGNSGTTTATFTVTMSPVNTSQTVTVDYATANGTSSAGVDNVAASGTLSFAPGVSTRTITVAINGDTVVEPNETFFVNLSNAVNAAVGDAQGVGTIVNDDGPMVTVSTTTVQPGGTIHFTVSNGPGNPTDWVGLYQVSSADPGGQLMWWYLNGTKTAPSPGRTSATLTFTAPTTPGSYNVRFFANNGYDRLATSATITVAP